MTRRNLVLTAARTIAGAPVAMGIANAPLHAQAPAAVPPIAYVASIKPNNNLEARGLSEYLPGGRFTATAVTVYSLLRAAFRIQPYQLVGAPAWISTKRYDIEAKIEDSPRPPQPAFLQALLRDRFHLLVRNESREMPRFALVLARSDGRLGPQLTRSAFDCAAWQAGPHPPPEPGRTPNCATRISMGALSGKAISMTQLASSLSPFVNRFVVDRTGLTGGFDAELTWTPEPDEVNVATGASPGAASSDSLGPSIFTAIQEQLGLKLASEKGPVDVVVVERVAEPSEN